MATLKVDGRLIPNSSDISRHVRGGLACLASRITRVISGVMESACSIGPTTLSVMTRCKAFRAPQNNSIVPVRNRPNLGAAARRTREIPLVGSVVYYVMPKKSVFVRTERRPWERDRAATAGLRRLRKITYEYIRIVWPWHRCLVPASRLNSPQEGAWRKPTRGCK